MYLENAEARTSNDETERVLKRRVSGIRHHLTARFALSTAQMLEVSKSAHSSVNSLLETFQYACVVEP